jgi:hypothetical protein
MLAVRPLSRKEILPLQLIETLSKAYALFAEIHTQIAAQR